ncbi:hypothetical protein RKD20_005418 [Streptomyces sp. SLBN-8D4]
MVPGSSRAGAGFASPGSRPGRGARTGYSGSSPGFAGAHQGGRGVRHGCRRLGTPGRAGPEDAVTGPAASTHALRRPKSPGPSRHHGPQNHRPSTTFPEPGVAFARLPTARHRRTGPRDAPRTPPSQPRPHQPARSPSRRARAHRAAPRAPKPLPEHHLPRAGRRLRSAADGPASPHRPPGRASDPAVTAPAAPTRTLTKPASTAHRGTTSPKTTAPALRTPGRAPELSRVRPGGQGSDRIEPCARARRRHTAPRPPHRPRGRASDSAVTGPARPGRCRRQVTDPAVGVSPC